MDKSCSDMPPVVDGVKTPSATRREEAYKVINESDDEVFQTHLYDWYLSQGWSDRLLEITSEYVVSYLSRMSVEDVAHADLLWRYYAHYHNYLDAADVQYKLAKSGFELSLERRIEYLSRAKANASTRVPGFSELGGVRSRQSRQELLRNITDLLDVANIQDDILQKMKSDIRLQGDRRREVLAKLDGNIMSLDEVSELISSLRQDWWLTIFSSITITQIKLRTMRYACSSTTLPTTAICLTSATHGRTSLSRPTTQLLTTAMVRPGNLLPKKPAR